MIGSPSKLDCEMLHFASNFSQNNNMFYGISVIFKHLWDFFFFNFPAEFF